MEVTSQELTQADAARKWQAAGWAHTRACDTLGVADVWVHRWRTRLRAHGALVDRAPCGNPVHRPLAWEEAAILELIERWGRVARPHRKLAHRGSYTGRVFVSPSSVLRVAARHEVDLPGEPPRPPRPARSLPQIPWERNRIWIWDATHFTRAKRVAYAIVDVVTLYWIGYLLTREVTSTQVQLLFAGALEDQGLLEPGTGMLLGRRAAMPRDDDRSPILVAWSDHGPEMTSAETREFMALMAIAQHHGRPSTPTDQAHVESFYSHLKGDWPHLGDIRDPAIFEDRTGSRSGRRHTVRQHAGIGYVTPDDEHHGRGPAIRRARIAGLKRAHQARIEHNRSNAPGAPHDMGSFPGRLYRRVRQTENRIHTEADARGHDIKISSTSSTCSNTCGARHGRSSATSSMTAGPHRRPLGPSRLRSRRQTASTPRQRRLRRLLDLHLTQERTRVHQSRYANNSIA